MKTVWAGVLFLLVGFGEGCASLRSPASGLLVTATQGPVTATAGAAGPRVGEACAHTILGMVAFGDASIEAARRGAGITEVTSVDQSFLQVFMFYGRSCTLVRGR